MRKILFKSALFVLSLLLCFTLVNIRVNTYANSIIDFNIDKIVGDFDFKSTDFTSVIVEIEEKSIVESKHSGIVQNKKGLFTIRNIIKQEIYDVIDEAVVGLEYDYLFSGFALTLQENNILQLAKINGIKAIYPNVHYVATEVEFNISEDSTPNMLNSNPYVGGVRAWELGYTGAGMTVAVIDTGVDYNHPELAHAFGEYKGYDFFDMDSDPMEGPGQYHGTHVSGTIVARSFGIAPDANLLVYRVLGPKGGSSEQVLAGIEQAVIDGADVMNLSLGNILNDPDYATSIALDWAMAEGVVAVTSNGNGGPDFWTVGSPGTSRSAISVGSTKLPHTDFDISFYTSENNSYESAKVMGTPSKEAIEELNGQTLEYVFVGLGAIDDFTEVDVDGKVALIYRGGISFTDKNYNAYINGAKACIIFNNAQGEISASGTWYIPTFQLTYEDGLKMYYDIFYGYNMLTINTTVDDIPETVSDFSSCGPAYGTWMIKPDLSAPGEGIFSTIPINLGGYAIASGTSMASPHVAAAALLVLQAHPDYSSEEVKAVLMNSAEPLINPLTNEAYPHNVQGAGSLRIANAIEASTIVNPGSFSFGKFVKNQGKQVESQHFEIKNLSSETKKYSFTVEFDGNPEGIKVMTSNNLLVKAGKTQTVNFNVQVDTSKLEAGYYEGIITVSDGKEEIKVPTILFVQEPDYPRVSFAGVVKYNEGYIAYAYLLGGADYVEIAFYEFDNGRIGNYLGWYSSDLNVQAGYYEVYWDGTINGVSIPSGMYVIIAYAEYKGKADIIAYLFEI